MQVDLSPEELVIILGWATSTVGEWGPLRPDEIPVEAKLRVALEEADDE